MRLIALLGVTFLLHFGSTTEAAQADDDVEVRQRGTNAIPIERQPPQYPSGAASAGTEGWVLVSFVVDVDGTTRDIEILDASKVDIFEKASRQAVEKWTYQPAVFDGQPVVQAKTLVLLTFLFQDSKGGVRRYFRGQYRKAVAAIQKEDFEKAKQIIDQLELRPQNIMAEIGYLDSLKGLYWQKKGDEQGALNHYERALVVFRNYSDLRTYKTLLTQSFFLNIHLGYLFDAMGHYNELVEVEGTLSPEHAVQKRAKLVQRTLDGDAPLPIQGKIHNTCSTCEESRPFWHHSLYRSRFTIDQIEGSITDFKLLCGFQYVTIAYASVMSWNVEDDWGQCDIHVYGSVGTTFRLVEHWQDK